MVAKQPCISVIMPVHNEEKSITRAVESILNQHFDNLELLLVDDGSTDRSGDLCDRYAERDYRVEVFHTQYQGKSAARNLALSHARGEYVLFCDATGWLTPKSLGELREFAFSNQLDLAVGGFYIDTFYGDEGEHLSELKSLPTQVFKSQDLFRHEAYRLFDLNLLYHPWNKLFKRSYIEQLGLTFEGDHWEDFPFVLQFLSDVERVGVLDTPCYHCIRENSEFNAQSYCSTMYEEREEEQQLLIELYKHWDCLNHAASNEMIQRRYIERLVGCIENVCSKTSPLTSAQKASVIRTMISTPSAAHALEVAQPRSNMMKMMLLPLKHGNVFMCKTMGHIITHVKNNNVHLFATLKARR